MRARRWIACLFAMGCAGTRHASSPVEIDHIWIVVSPGAPERAVLEGAGLRVAPGVHRHDGQGTASVMVELQNSFLKLLWPDSSVSVSPGLEPVARRFQRRMQWRTSHWSPFGIGLRRTPTAPDSLPFRTRKVRADWMAPGATLELLTTGSDSLAPSIWVVPRSMSALEDSGRVAMRDDSERAALFEHPIGVRRLTAARVLTPSDAGFAPATQLLDSLGVARFDRGPQWLLELTFDGGSRGLTKDFRPQVPLMIRY